MGFQIISNGFSRNKSFQHYFAFSYYSKHYFHFHKRLGYDLSLTPNLFVIYYQGQDRPSWPWIPLFSLILKEEIVQQQCQTVLLYTLQINPQPKNSFFVVYKFSCTYVLCTSVAILALNFSPMCSGSIGKTVSTVQITMSKFQVYLYICSAHLFLGKERLL